MKNFFGLLLLSFLLSACTEEATLPVGFEHMSKDGRSHFIFIHEEFIGNKVAQRETGRIICTKLFKEEDYCEVYYFSKREEVPMKFPIMNRLRPIGIYELKGGKENFKAV